MGVSRGVVIAALRYALCFFGGLCGVLFGIVRNALHCGPLSLSVYTLYIWVIVRVVWLPVWGVLPACLAYSARPCKAMLSFMSLFYKAYKPYLISILRSS